MAREIKLSVQKSAVAEAAMLARMQTGRFTFKELYRVGNEAAGVVMNGPEGDAYRLADRLLQRERRAGRIRLVTNVEWELA